MNKKRIKFSKEVFKKCKYCGSEFNECYKIKREDSLSEEGWIWSIKCKRLKQVGGEIMDIKSNE